MLSQKRFIVLIPDDVGSMNRADDTSGRAVPLAALAVAPARDKVAASNSSGQAFSVIDVPVVDRPIDDVVHDAHHGQRKEGVEDERQRVDVDLKEVTTVGNHISSFFKWAKPGLFLLIFVFFTRQM